MKMSRFKKVSSLAVASALALGTASYSSSAAAVQKCVDWGCGRVNVEVLPYPPYDDRVYGRSLDRRTDGWCVQQRLRRVGRSWPGEIIKNSTDCNGTWNYYSITVGIPYAAGVRLYRADNGRYLTLFGS